jgi:hypothetical protein
VVDGAGCGWLGGRGPAGEAVSVCEGDHDWWKRHDSDPWACRQCGTVMTATPPDPTLTEPTRPGPSPRHWDWETRFVVGLAILFGVIIGSAIYATSRDRPDWDLIREPSTGRTFQCHRYQDDLCVEVFP